MIGVMDLGGAETLIMNVFRSIDRSRIMFDFLSLSLKVGAYDSEIVQMGGRVFRISPPSTAGFFESGLAFRAILRQAGPFDVVHSHVQKFSGFFAFLAATHGIAVRVVHSHTTRDSRNDHGTRRLYSAVMKVLIRRFATSLVGCSIEACDALFGEKCHHDPRVSVVRNAIIWERFLLWEGKRDEARRLLGVESDAIVLCHVGNLVTPKNHEFLIKIFGELVKEIPGARLMLIGDGPLRGDIEAMVDALGVRQSVTFLGRRRDVPALLCAADMFVFPSLYEGVPTALIEAQMAGLQCLASARITPQADLGLGLTVFRELEQSPEQWARQIVSMLGHQAATCLADRMGALVRAGYDIVAVTRILERIYCEAAVVAQTRF